MRNSRMLSNHYFLSINCVCVLFLLPLGIIFNHSNACTFKALILFKRENYLCATPKKEVNKYKTLRQEASQQHTSKYAEECERVLQRKCLLVFHSTSLIIRSTRCWVEEWKWSFSRLLFPLMNCFDEWTSEGREKSSRENEWNEINLKQNNIFPSLILLTWLQAYFQE
jgi:hypothetical protein